MIVVSVIMIVFLVSIKKVYYISRNKTMLLSIPVTFIMPNSKTKLYELSKISNKGKVIY